MAKKSKETVYRSPNGERWHIVNHTKWSDTPLAVRVRDGYVSWNSNLNELVEETEWLKTNDPNPAKKKKKR